MGTPEGDIWFASLAGSAVPGSSYSEAMRGKGPPGFVWDAAISPTGKRCGVHEHERATAS
jgi:hypothetical protein